MLQWHVVKARLLFIPRNSAPKRLGKKQQWCLHSHNTPLYATVLGKKLVGTAKANSYETALTGWRTGEVHIIPTEIVINEEHKPYKPGDVIFLLTYEGEGIYKVWNKGEIYSDGEVYELFENGSGKEGWTKETRNFGNMARPALFN